MIIKQIKLYNIRSYDSITIEFKKDISLLAGDIGSGKSSILLAIEFALFGFIKGTVSGESLLRKGQTKGYVELSFEIDNKEIIIQRTLSKSKTGVNQSAGFIIIDDIKHDLTPKELKSKILELLGYPQNLLNKSKELLFRYTVYTPQELMKEILYDQSENRLDAIRKIFDLEKYKIIKNNLTIANQYMNKEIDHNSNIIRLYENNEELLVKVQEHKTSTNIKLESTKHSIDVHKKELNELENQKIELSKKIDLFNHKKNKLQLLKKTMLDKQNQIDSLNKTTNEINNKISELNPKIKEISFDEINEELINKKIIELNSKIGELTNQRILTEQKLKSNENLFEELNKTIMTLRRSLINKNTIEKEFNENSTKIEGIQKLECEIKEKDTLRNEINAKIKHLQLMNKESQNTISNIESLTECPKCMQNVNEEHKKKIKNEEESKIKLNNEKILNLENELNNLTLNTNNINYQLTLLKELKSQNLIKKYELEKIKEYEKEYSEAFTRLTKINDEKSNLVKTISEFNSDEIIKLKQDLENLKIDLEKAKKQNIEISIQKQIKFELENYNKTITQYNELIKSSLQIIDLNNTEIIELENDLANNVIENEFKLFNENYNQKIKNVHELEITLNVLINELKNIELQIKKLDENQIALNNATKKLKKTKTAKEWITTDFVELINLIEKKTLSVINQQFNEYFQDWFNLLIENNIVARIDEDFNIIISVDGYDYEIESLSGGEKTSIALAYRLALNQVINSVQNKIKTKDLLILDEPTDGFSKEQLDRVREVLKSTSAKQIIIVSHENVMESFADHVIKIEKVNNKSEITSY